jgi:1,4-dihydroxy-6-naphthoate synthase
MKKNLTLGFSPCPNDTFMFYPLLQSLVDTGGYRFNERLEDVETLNRLAIQGVLDVTKISYATLGHVREGYALLRAGSALGRGCGPLLVAREQLDPASLQGKTIAIPGLYTTAHLLLRLFDQGLSHFLELPFHKIMDAVMSGQVDAGVIIHESRFTYQGYGLHQLMDLGQWWEGETGLPIPLGGIVAKRSLGAETIRTIERALTAGVEYARSNPQAAVQYIREHAQEMSAEVCAAHIGLYVNNFSQQLGNEGERAIAELLRRAEATGIIPVSEIALFI